MADLVLRYNKNSLLEYIVMAATAALVLFFSLFVDGFANLGNFKVIASNSAALLMLSCGMGVVIISRGLDLSVVAAMVAGAATFGILTVAGWSVFPAFVVSVLAVLAIGVFNGWLIAYVEIPAMLTTLATAMVITGFFRYEVLNGEYLLMLPSDSRAVQLLSGDTPAILAVIVFIASWMLLRYTTMGRVTYALGDNAAAARLSGLPVRLTTLGIYAFAALTALFAGLVVAAASSTVDFRIVTNGSLLFEAILVVVLGGIPLRGGRGGMRNILVGLALIAVLRNGMTLLNLTTQTQDMFKGVVLLIAIVIDNYINPRDTENDTVGDL
jgi:ribose transport system permease protein